MVACNLPGAWWLIFGSLSKKAIPLIAKSDWLQKDNKTGINKWESRLLGIHFSWDDDIGNNEAKMAGNLSI